MKTTISLFAILFSMNTFALNDLALNPLERAQSIEKAYVDGKLTGERLQSEMRFIENDINIKTAMGRIARSIARYEASLDDDFLVTDSHRRALAKKLEILKAYRDAGGTFDILEQANSESNAIVFSSALGNIVTNAETRCAAETIRILVDNPNESPYSYVHKIAQPAVDAFGKRMYAQDFVTKFGLMERWYGAKDRDGSKGKACKKAASIEVVDYNAIKPELKIATGEEITKEQQVITPGKIAAGSSVIKEN